MNISLVVISNSTNVLTHLATCPADLALKNIQAIVNKDITVKKNKKNY